ncbi:hypothetical protein T492DRAFT_1146698, partial [Pavlovales sp. CCMP2436]
MAKDVGQADAMAEDLASKATQQLWARSGGELWPVEIVGEEDAGRVLITFVGWASSWDRWLDRDELQTCSPSSRRRPPRRLNPQPEASQPRAKRRAGNAGGGMPEPLLTPAAELANGGDEPRPSRPRPPPAQPPCVDRTGRTRAAHSSLGSPTSSSATECSVCALPLLAWRARGGAGGTSRGGDGAAVLEPSATIEPAERVLHCGLCGETAHATCLGDGAVRAPDASPHRGPAEPTPPTSAAVPVSAPDAPDYTCALCALELCRGTLPLAGDLSDPRWLRFASAQLRADRVMHADVKQLATRLTRLLQRESADDRDNRVALLAALPPVASEPLREWVLRVLGEFAAAAPTPGAQVAIPPGGGAAACVLAGLRAFSGVILKRGGEGEAREASAESWRVLKVDTWASELRETQGVTRHSLGARAALCVACQLATVGAESQAPETVARARGGRLRGAAPVSTSAAQAGSNLSLPPAEALAR